MNVFGHLLIAGGNLRSSEIYKEFINLAGGKSASIAIVPTASYEAESTLLKLTDIFIQCDVERHKIIPIRIDPDKDDVEWKKSGDDFSSLDFLNEVKGVWFTGGDQVKIIRGFLKDDGYDTKILKKIREILASGGVIGGCSAGAAIMSEVMIGGGTSLGALSLPHYHDYKKYRKNPKLEEDGALLIMKGLGFFKCGVVDQHFDSRNRIGRLIETLFSEKINKGFGISENTALIYDFESNSISTIGTGGAALLDVSGASRIKIGDYSKITNVKINYLNDNITYNVKENKFSISKKDEMSDNEAGVFENYISSVIANLNFDINIPAVEDKKKDFTDIYLTGDEDMEYSFRVYKKQGFCNTGSLSNDLFNAVMDIIPVISNADAFNAAE